MASLLPAVLREDAVDPEIIAPLVGAWTTDAPRYSDRTLTISPESIVFGTGVPGEGQSYAIQAVRRGEGRSVREYSIEYDGSTGPGTLDMTVHEDGAITLRNRPTVRWQREVAR